MAAESQPSSCCSICLSTRTCSACTCIHTGIPRRRLSSAQPSETPQARVQGTDTAGMASARGPARDSPLRLIWTALWDVVGHGLRDSKLNPHCHPLQMAFCFGNLSRALFGILTLVDLLTPAESRLFAPNENWSLYKDMPS